MINYVKTETQNVKLNKTFQISVSKFEYLSRYNISTLSAF